MSFRNFLIACLILACSSVGVAHAQKQKPGFRKISASIPDDPNLDSLIERMTDGSMQCLPAVDTFRLYRDHHPNDPRAWLYLGRAYDKVGSFIDGCEFSDSGFFPYVDSAYYAYSYADSIQPGIREVHIGFTAPQFIGHSFAMRAMWWLKQHDLAKARTELRKGYDLGGFPGKLLDAARTMLSGLDSNAILFTSGDDMTFPFWYVQFVEGFRSDVSMLNLSLLNMYWYQNLYREGLAGAIAPVAFPKLGEIDSLAFDPDNLNRIKAQILVGGPPDTITVDHAAIARIKSHWPTVAVPTQIITQDFRKYSLAAGDIGPVGDFALYTIIRSNQWRRPIYFDPLAPLDQFKGLNAHLRTHPYSRELLPVDAVLRQGDSKDWSQPLWVDTRELDTLLAHPEPQIGFNSDTIIGRSMTWSSIDFIKGYFKSISGLTQASLDSVMPRVRKLLQTGATTVPSPYGYLLFDLAERHLDVTTELAWAAAGLRQYAMRKTSLLDLKDYEYGMILIYMSKCDELKNFLQRIVWAKSEQRSINREIYDDIMRAAVAHNCITNK